MSVNVPHCGAAGAATHDDEMQVEVEQTLAVTLVDEHPVICAKLPVA